jgi:hypothetical protein
MRNADIKLNLKVLVSHNGRRYEGTIGSAEAYTMAYGQLGRTTQQDDGFIWVDGRNDEKGWVPLASVTPKEWSK